MSREGGMPRYRALRDSIGSIGFLPLAFFNSEEHALAAEASLISSTRPKCNGLDTAHLAKTRGLGVALRPERSKRRRPPGHVRRLGLPRRWQVCVGPC